MKKRDIFAHLAELECDAANARKNGNDALADQLDEESAELITLQIVETLKGVGLTS